MEGAASLFSRFLVLGLFLVLFICFLGWRKRKSPVQPVYVTPIKKKGKKSRRGKRSNVESNVESSETSGIESFEISAELVSKSVSLGGHEKIGNLIVYTKVVIEERNDGIIVFEGSYFYRQVAVKRVPQTYRKVAINEESFLIDCDKHENIVRLHIVEEDKNFVYLALDSCDYNFYEFVMKHKSKDRSMNSNANSTEIKLWMTYGYPSSRLLKLMRDIVNGIAYLHGKGILHGNIKPHNILIKKNFWRAFISDMSISKKLDEMPLITGFENQSLAYAADLFSLGCVFYFCVSGGYHPFDEENFSCDSNIVGKKEDLSRIEGIPEAKHLITSLLDPNPLSRPDIEQVRIHPLLWDSKIKLSFLTVASYRLESEFRMNANSTLLQELEKTGNVGNWSEKMDSDFLRNITTVHKPKVYEFCNVRNLVLLIRKASCHYYDYPENIQEILGTLPEEFVYNFSKKFPNLFMAVYTVIKTHCKEEQYFRKYFTAEYVYPLI